MSRSWRIWIQGAGEMASGAAVALLAAGHQVVMAETANPLSVRRLVCFSEAVYEGSIVVDRWLGRLSAPATAAWNADSVDVVVDPEALHLARLKPDCVVDARMTKVRPQPLPTGGCSLIGLGPGFECGVNADLVVETMRGPDLGRVLSVGQAQAYTGVPGPVAGATTARLLRSPAAGHLVPLLRIGDLVREGEIIGHVAGQPVRAGVSGMLRGLVHHRAELVCGEKVGDVDPRGKGVDPAAMTDKASGVGKGVARAISLLASG